MTVATHYNQFGHTGEHPIITSENRSLVTGYELAAPGRFADIGDLLSGSSEGLMPAPDMSNAPTVEASWHSTPLHPAASTEATVAREQEELSAFLEGLSDDDLKRVAITGLKYLTSKYNDNPNLTRWARDQARASFGYEKLDD